MWYAMGLSGGSSPLTPAPDTQHSAVPCYSSPTRCLKWQVSDAARPRALWQSSHQQSSQSTWDLCLIPARVQARARTPHGAVQCSAEVMMIETLKASSHSGQGGHRFLLLLCARAQKVQCGKVPLHSAAAAQIDLCLCQRSMQYSETLHRS